MNARFASPALLAALALASAVHAAPEVIVDRAGPDIFPASWLTAKIAAKAGVLDADLQPRYRRLVAEALGKYPAALTDANLAKVYVVGHLEYSGVSTGGSNSRSAVYLVAREKYPPADIERNFHAEFSSILLRNFPGHLDQAAWRRINPPDFQYRGSGVKAVQKGQASQRSDPALHAAGFFNEYATASIEEDFNSLAGRLFMGDAALRNGVENFPRLKAKADLVIAFYGKLDSALTPEFFASLQRPADEQPAPR